MCGGTCPKTACTAGPLMLGKRCPFYDVSVKLEAYFNHEMILGHSCFKDKIVAVTQRQTRVGINGWPRVDEEDGCSTSISMWVENHPRPKCSFVTTAITTMKNHALLTGIMFAAVVVSGCVTATTDEQVIVSFAPLSVAAGNEQATDGFTPLHSAARDGEYAVVKRLLGQGKSVNAASTVSGVTPLILAAQMGHEPIVDVLLDAGAAVNTTDTVNCTALMYASSKGYVGIVNKLLQRGADVNVKSPKDQLDSTALTLAAGNGHDAVLELLLKAGADIDWRTERDGFSALLLAAELGHWKSVSILLSAGANPDLKDRNGNTACDLATVNGHGAVTKVLDDFYLARGQAKRCRSGTTKTGMPAAN
jgi:ankyrin repeat protein